MELVIDPDFLADLQFWTTTDARTGKPEPLKHLGAGVWSRRITQADRLVYLVESGRVRLLQCRYHY